MGDDILAVNGRAIKCWVHATECGFMCDVEPQGVSIHTLQRVYRRDSADHGFHQPSSYHKGFWCGILGLYIVS